jgi:putative NADH-flavin reductase
VKLVIFGATGRTGRPLVAQALAAGHEVTVFVRDPAKISVSHERLRTVQGDIRDADRVEAAVQGQDAVLSVLGRTRGSASDVLTVGATNIVSAMKKNGVRRLVSLVGAGVRDPHDLPPSVGSRVTTRLLKLLAGNVLADARQHADLVRRSGLDWSLVRPPRLTQARRTGRYRAGYLQLGVRDTVARADVAAFMLKLATGGDFVHEAPMISSYAKAS